MAAGEFVIFAYHFREPLGDGEAGVVCDKIVGDNPSMTQVNIEDIQRDPSKYLQRVEAGESLLILRAGKPVAEVNPIGAGLKAARPFGLSAGKFTVPDDFDAPLPEEILNSFEGK